MRLFQMIQDYFSPKEEDIDDSWGEDIANLYNNELKDNVEEWEIHRDESGEKVAKHIK